MQTRAPARIVIALWEAASAGPHSALPYAQIARRAELGRGRAFEVLQELRGLGLIALGDGGAWLTREGWQETAEAISWSEAG